MKEKSGTKEIPCPKDFDLVKNTRDYAIKEIEKAQKGGFLGLKGKKSKEYLEEMADTFFKTENNSAADLIKNNPDKTIKEIFKDISPNDYAKKTFQSNVKAGASVLGAFIGAVAGCAIITPIIRDVSAYVVQKQMEKKQPELKEKPYRPYFDPSYLESDKYNKVAKQPLSMQSYMSFTNGTLKI